MLGYGQQAAGTHPTGMHSCFARLFAVENCMKLKEIVPRKAARVPSAPLDPPRPRPFYRLSGGMEEARVLRFCGEEIFKDN